MGVYIKGMETPSSCGDCKAFVCYRQWAGDVGDCFCGITKNDAEAKKKNADCPLVPAADVRPVVLCGACELHGHCYTEDVFAFVRLAEENRFCAVGKVKTNGVKREES